MQFDHHCPISCLQSEFSLGLVRNNLQQFLATSLELIFFELAALSGQRSLQILRPLLVRATLSFKEKRPRRANQI